MGKSTVIGVHQEKDSGQLLKPPVTIALLGNTLMTGDGMVVDLVPQELGLQEMVLLLAFTALRVLLVTVLEIALAVLLVHGQTNFLTRPAVLVLLGMDTLLMGKDVRHVVQGFGLCTESLHAGLAQWGNSLQLVAQEIAQLVLQEGLQPGSTHQCVMHAGVDSINHRQGDRSARNAIQFPLLNTLHLSAFLIACVLMDILEFPIKHLVASYAHQQTQESCVPLVAFCLT
jgi:hypothetical protein